jgi:hypothetical protein
MDEVTTESRAWTPVFAAYTDLVTFVVEKLPCKLREHVRNNNDQRCELRT